MSNPEAMPDLEHTGFTVKNLEIRDINGRKIIEASIEEIEPMGGVQRIHNRIGELKEDGSFNIYEDYDKPEVRRTVEKFLSEHPDFQKTVPET